MIFFNQPVGYSWNIVANKTVMLGLVKVNCFTIGTVAVIAVVEIVNFFCN